jgi:hypothetical protein
MLNAMVRSDQNPAETSINSQDT